MRRVRLRDAGPDPGDVIQARAVLAYRAQLEGNEDEVARVEAATIDALRAIASEHIGRGGASLALHWLGQPV